MENMHNLYYQPEDGWLGDIMPCYHNGTYYLYYQCDKRIPASFPNGTPFGWSLATTQDMRNFKDYGEVLGTGARGTREEWLYAGSVIYAKGCFRAFYTGHCDGWSGQGNPPAEALMLAVSGDGIHWTKKPKLTFSAPDGYEKDYFRDPHVFFCEEENTWMLIAPARRKDGPSVRRGAMLYYTSEDLEHWSFCGELWYPKMYHLLQMPDLFKIGGWWYLFFSEYCDERKTRYRMSRSIHGPWLAPGDDSLDSRCFYAARTIAADGKRYLFGWNPTRENDLSMWMWGGTAVIQEIVQREDGTLGTVIPALYRQSFIPKTESFPKAVELSRLDGCDEQTLFENPGENFCVSWTFSFRKGTQSFGVRLYMDNESDVGYTFEFRPPENRIIFDKLPMEKWFTYMNREMQRPLDLEPGKEYRAALIVDGDMAVLYAEDTFFNVRMCEKPGCELRMFANAGGMKISNIKVFDIPKPSL